MSVLLLHGWAVNAKTYWFPYIKRELEKRKVKVYAPNLPRSKMPNLSSWSSVISRHLLKMKSPKVVICHSLGGVAMLRTLEEIKIPVDLVVFVGVPLRVHTKRKFLAKFFKVRYKWSAIRKNIKEAIVIHAKNDQLVSYINGRGIARALHGKLITPRVGGHFTTKKFPLLLDIILKLNLQSAI